MMDTLIARFPEQLREALEIGSKAMIHEHSKEIQNVYVAGLGGSGIGANFVKEFVADELKIPFSVGKGYSIPASVGEHTLAIASSYSGNTEETLSSFEMMKETGAKIVVISSGGKLIEYAKTNGYDYIQVPGNWPSPRACLGYSVVQQLFVLHKLGLISDTAINGVESSISLIEGESDAIKEEAMEVAKRLHNKIPIIYTTDRMSAVAVRQRQQINENSKMLCWHHIVPEMNHNELVGWRKKSDQWAVLYLRNDDDVMRNAARIDINKEIISKYADTIVEIYSKGTSLVERMIYLVHLGDWMSFYLCELHGTDSIEIEVIDFLKSSLAKL